MAGRTATGWCGSPGKRAAMQVVTSNMVVLAHLGWKGSPPPTARRQIGGVGGRLYRLCRGWRQAGAGALSAGQLAELVANRSNMTLPM